MKCVMIFTVVLLLFAGACFAQCDFDSIAGGGLHTIALKSDGTVWTFGYNYDGQLGDGTNTDINTPVHVVGPGGVGFLTDIIAIAGGGWHTIALKSDGTVWTFGWNEHGQLGDGTNTTSYTPVHVVGPGGVGFLTDIIAIAGSWDHTIALKSDGTVWTFGDNWFGQLGDGTNTDSNTPVQVVGPGGVGFLTDIIAIAGGGLHTIALKSDGTVWTFGDNGDGQLGDGTTTWSSNTPVEVDCSGMDVFEDKGILPDALSIRVFPNPFNSSCAISAPERAEIEIFDINGRIVYETPVGAGLRPARGKGGSETAPLRNETVIWQPDKSLGSGVYLVRAKIGDESITKRVVYLK